MATADSDEVGRDCNELDEKAEKIFEKINRFFPPAPPYVRGDPQWKHEGIVYDKVNGEEAWFDLRLSLIRSMLIQRQRNLVAAVIGAKARAYMALPHHQGSLEGFTNEKYTAMAKHTVTLLILLEDLDEQINSGK